MVRALKQVLILVSGDPERRAYYFRLLECLVSESILQRNKATFDYHRFNVNLDELLKGFQAMKISEQQAEEIKLLQSKLSNSGKDIQTIQSLLIEREQECKKLQASQAETQDKLNYAQAEVTALKLKLDHSKKAMQEMKQQSDAQLEIVKVERNRALSNPPPRIVDIDLSNIKVPQELQVTPAIMAFFQKTVREKLGVSPGKIGGLTPGSSKKQELPVAPIVTQDVMEPISAVAPPPTPPPPTPPPPPGPTSGPEAMSV